MYRYKMLVVFLIAFTGAVCSRDRTSKILEWATKEIEHEGFPLLLRKPVYDDIWLSQKRYKKLLIITHILEKVKANGLPEAGYNSSLADFDQDVVGITKDKDCLLILIETFAGKRHYYFYVTENFSPNTSVKHLQLKYQNHKLLTEIKVDEKWNFFRNYPVKLD